MASVQNLYADHFGMTDRPFSPLADGRSFYWSASHTRAQAALEYGLMSGAALTVLTGAPGTGKTSLILNMMQDADEDLQLAMVRMPHSGVQDLSGWILQSLGHDGGGDQSQLTRHAALHSALISTYAEGGRTVLIFDDAHDLADDALHELRLLADLNTAQDQLVQIILCGHPNLLNRLTSDTHAALSQRIAARGHLEPMLGAEAGLYMADRLNRVGAAFDMFEAGAVKTIEEATQGLPRLINQLAELTLVYLMTSDETRVSRDLVEQVIADGLFVAPQQPGAAHLRVASSVRPI